MAGTLWGDIVTLVASNLGKFADGVVEANVAALMPRWARSILTDMVEDRNYWFLRQTGTMALKAQVQRYPLPPGFSEGASLYLIFNNPNKAYVELKPVYSRQEIIRLYNPAMALSDCAQPVHVLVDDDGMEFWPCPDQRYLVGADFWGDMDPPTDADPASQYSNFVIDHFPYWFECMLTARGFGYTQEDEDEKMWMAKAERKLADLRARHVARVMGSDHMMRPRTDAYADNFTERGNGWVTYFWGS